MGEVVYGVVFIECSITKEHHRFVGCVIDRAAEQAYLYYQARDDNAILEVIDMPNQITDFHLEPLAIRQACILYRLPNVQATPIRPTSGESFVCVAGIPHQQGSILQRARRRLGPRS